MAHLTSSEDVEFENAVGTTWGTVTHFGLVDTASGAGILLFSDDIANFAPADGADVRIPSGKLDFNVPNGDMPDSEALTMFRAYLAHRITDLALDTAGIGDTATDFTDVNGKVYVALYTAAPDASDITADEVTAGSGTRTASPGGTQYFREPVTLGNSNTPAATIQTGLLLASTA